MRTMFFDPAASACADETALTARDGRTTAGSRRVRWSWSLAVAVLLLTPCPAWAQQAVSLHGLGDVTVGYSDNLLAAPSEPEPGQPGPQAASFVRLATGLALVHETSRAQHLLTLVHGTNFAIGIGDEHSSSDTAAWEAFFALSPRDELTLGASIEQASTRVAVLSQPTAQGAANPQAAGDDVVVSSGLSERYAYELSERWRANQNATLEVAAPRQTEGPQPTRMYPRLGVGMAYTLSRDAFGLQSSAGYFWQSAYGDGPERQSSSAQILAEARGEWSHDLDSVWSTLATVGMAEAMLADDPTMMVAAATWGAALRFDHVGYAAEIAGERVVVPNMLLSQILLTDQARASGGVPLIRTWDVYAASTLAYAHHRTLDAERGGFANAFDTALADVALEWRAESLPWVALRYQHQRQLGDEAGRIPIEGFQRNTVSISAGYMFPPRALPRVPVVPPRRVDGGDREPTAPADDAAARRAGRRG